MSTEQDDSGALLPPEHRAHPAAYEAISDTVEWQLARARVEGWNDCRAEVARRIAALSPQGSEPAGVGDDHVRIACARFFGVSGYSDYQFNEMREAIKLATPAPAQQAVTDEMVERAFVAMRRFDCFFLFDHDTLRRLIRDWLTAALNTTAQGASDA